MADHAVSGTEQARAPVNLLLAAFGIVGAPMAWSLNLMINYALASQACYPGHSPLGGNQASYLVLALIDAIAILTALAAGVASHRIWRHSRRVGPGGFDELLEMGEGRTRFLGMWGLMFSIAFLGALIFDVIALVMVTPCSY